LLYRNLGAKGFDDVSWTPVSPAQLSISEMAGAPLFDMDNDTWLDLWSPMALYPQIDQSNWPALP